MNFSLYKSNLDIKNREHTQKFACLYSFFLEFEDEIKKIQFREHFQPLQSWIKIVGIYQSLFVFLENKIMLSENVFSKIYFDLELN